MKTRRSTHAAFAVAIGLLSVVATAGADLRVGSNYRLDADSSPFRGKDQPALAVDPRDAKHIVEVNANYLTENCEATVSFDGGRTWSDAVSLLPPDPGLGQPYHPSCRISNHAGETMYQTLAFGSGNTVYATSIVPRQGASYLEQGAGLIVYKSLDGGRTWEKGVEAMAGGPGNPSGGSLTPAMGPYYELPTLAVDVSAGTNGADRIYVAAREITGNGESPSPCGGSTGSPCVPHIRVAMSDDGAQTFSPPRRASAAGVPIAGPEASSQPVVNPDHSVSIAWRTLGATGRIEVARSEDQGETWSPPVDVTGVTNVGRNTSTHTTVLPAAGSTFPRLAGDPANGRLYLVYNQGGGGPTAPPGGYKGADHFISPDSRVYFQRSLDGGATWSTPKQIGDATPRPGTELVQTRHPDVDVAPNGRVDVVWQDRRHWYQGPGNRNCIHTHIACDDARLGDTYYAYSTDGGATFSEERRITDRSHSNDVGYDYRFGTNWAFGPQSVALGDDRVLIAWMDSREGNFDNDNQDIYLAQVDHNGPAGPSRDHIDRANATELALALSSFAYPGGGESLLVNNFATRAASFPVIVGEDDVAGALAGAVLARARLAPLLLSPAGALPAAVRTDISRFNAPGAILLGDTAKLSDQVLADVTAASPPGATISRIAGANDADTAAKVALALDRRSDSEKAAGNPAFDAVTIVNPGSPHAAAAAALASARRLPVLFAGKDSVPAETSAALSALNITKTLVIGGTDVIGDAVASQLPGAERLGGTDQFETSRAVVAEAAKRGMPSNVAMVADGAKPMDAILAGAALGRTTGQLVLAKAPLHGSATAAATDAGLTKLDRITVLGSLPPAPPANNPATNPPGGNPPASNPPGGNPPGTSPPPKPVTPTRCGTVSLVRRNASKRRTRTETRVRLPCAGTMRVAATTEVKVRVKRKLRTRTVKLKVRQRRLSGRNRAIRVDLKPGRVRRELTRARRLTVRITIRFTPETRTAESAPSRRTVKVVVRLPRKRGR